MTETDAILNTLLSLLGDTPSLILMLYFMHRLSVHYESDLQYARGRIQNYHELVVRILNGLLDKPPPIENDRQTD